jgi:hypothetical protein
MYPDYNHTWENIEEPVVILYAKHRMEFIYEVAALNLALVRATFINHALMLGLALACLDLSIFPLFTRICRNTYFYAFL